MSDRPDPESETTPDVNDWRPQAEDEWGSLPVTKFLCPVHGVPEERQIVSQGGERMYRYACPVAGCSHEWTVKRIRA